MSLRGLMVEYAGIETQPEAVSCCEPALVECEAYRDQQVMAMP